MTLSEFFYWLGGIFEWTFRFLDEDVVGNKFNYSVIVLGFVGLFYWLNLQRKMNNKAKNDSNQRK